MFLFSEITLFFLFLTSKGIRAQSSSCLNHCGNDSPPVCHQTPSLLLHSKPRPAPRRCTKKHSNVPLSYLKLSILNPFAAPPPGAVINCQLLSLEYEPSTAQPTARSFPAAQPPPRPTLPSGLPAACWLISPSAGALPFILRDLPHCQPFTLLQPLSQASVVAPTLPETKNLCTGLF